MKHTCRKVLRSRKTLARLNYEASIADKEHKKAIEEEIKITKETVATMKLARDDMRKFISSFEEGESLEEDDLADGVGGRLRKRRKEPITFSFATMLLPFSTQICYTRTKKEVFPMLQTVNDARQMLAPVFDQYGVSKAVLFGSVAKGDGHFPKSDLDLLVQSDFKRLEICRSHRSGAGSCRDARGRVRCDPTLSRAPSSTRKSKPPG